MFFAEITPGALCLNKQFRLKKHYVAKDTLNFVDGFCWQLRDGINDIVENQIKVDFSVHVINDTDKNLGPANADKSDVIKECKTQLFDVVTYLKLSEEEGKLFY